MKYYRDLKQSAEANAARYKQHIEELQCTEARNAGIRVFLLGIALVIIVALIESYCL